MYRGLSRFRLRPSSIFNFRRKASNSLFAVQDTFYSAKDIFERHKVVFTISTSIASVATAWAGYSLRHYHESKVDQRLEAIEKAMKSNYDMDSSEVKRIVSRPAISVPACLATAGTSLIIGYGLGWRGGAWYTSRKLRREQMKLLGLLKPKIWQRMKMLGQLKPQRWPLKFLRRPMMKFKSNKDATN